MVETVVYGLAWFDVRGDLHDELLQRETELFEGDRVRIFDARGELMMGEAVPPALATALVGPLRRIASGVQPDLYADYAGQHVYLLPLFGDDSDAVRGVACVTRSDTALQASITAFVGWLLAALGAVAVVGIWVARTLAARSVLPVAALLQQRERFVSAAGHELRTPLATIRTVAESALAGDEPAPRALARTMRVLEDAEAKVEALLAHARVDAGSYEPAFERTRIDGLVESLVESLPEAQLDLEPVTAAVDIRMFQLAIANILTNATKYGDAAQGRGLRIRLRRGAIRFSDDGPGFSVDYLARDDARYGWSSSPAGHGIGLALAEQVARMHGGALELSNEDGAVVTLSFAHD
ncbi:MAG: HAMP domain-containing sensor histidine kinase [Myxococcota bacterium]